VAALVLLAAAAFTFAHRKPPPAQPPADALILTRPDIAQSPRVVKLIPVACVAASAVLNPERGELFVSEVTANSVAIIDVGSNKVIARIPVGREPGAMAFSPDRKKLFIAQGDGLGVIDTATHSFQLASDLKNRVDDVLVMPDGKFAYLALGFLGLAKLDIASRSVKILSKIGYAIALALTPDGRRLYVSYQGGGPGGRFGHDAIGYFDTATDTFAGSMSGFANVGGVLAVSRDGSHLWESGADACDSPQYDHVGCPAVPAGLINIFNPNGNKLVRSVAVRGARLLGMTFSPDGQYVAVGSTHGLLLLDSRSYSIVATSPYGSTLKIAFTPDGSKAYSPVNEIPAIAVIQVSVEVRALRLSNRDDRDHALEIGIVTGPDYSCRVYRSRVAAARWRAGRPKRLGHPGRLGGRLSGFPRTQLDRSLQSGGREETFQDGTRGEDIRRHADSRYRRCDLVSDQVAT
jgi:YVTN family beta-propeller protein